MSHDEGEHHDHRRCHLHIDGSGGLVHCEETADLPDMVRVFVEYSSALRAGVAFSVGKGVRTVEFRGSNYLCLIEYARVSLSTGPKLADAPRIPINASMMPPYLPRETDDTASTDVLDGYVNSSFVEKLR